jgi:hypothetical protein
MKPKHKCPYYDFLELHPFDLEMSACRCDFEKPPRSYGEVWAEQLIKGLFGDLNAQRDDPNK